MRGGDEDVVVFTPCPSLDLATLGVAPLPEVEGPSVGFVLFTPRPSLDLGTLAPLPEVEGPSEGSSTESERKESLARNKINSYTCVVRKAKKYQNIYPAVQSPAAPYIDRASPSFDPTRWQALTTQNVERRFGDCLLVSRSANDPNLLDSQFDVVPGQILVAHSPPSWLAKFGAHASTEHSCHTAFPEPSWPFLEKLKETK